ncbi:MAG: NAD(P)-dependent glycerol-3-phosphate dehydrogenase [Deltaproteobacteria bacterium]|jgi:glycerol-3-phosphate dehydrogenase (NAD(P)+)|nr:NAD(P)-dependent glycerol-3-phosphate dehydrogenase [Deltaproteobacteria bacterium]
MGHIGISGGFLPAFEKAERKVAVVGAGAWGTTLALHASRQGLRPVIWARRDSVAREINETCGNPSFLPGVTLPRGVKATSDPVEAMSGAALVLWVVPSHGLREVARHLLPHLSPGAVQISASQGIENDSFLTMTRILAQESPKGLPTAIGALSGPSFASEVAQGLPTALTLGMEDSRLAKEVQALLSAPTFRIYTTQDTLGVELGGALKNVYAIAAGICDGLCLGLNARAAFLTRALAEMTRLARVMGAEPLTLSGLSGMGDLILTATGGLSRNRQVGLRLGQGESLGLILAGRRDVAEGVLNTKSVWGMAQHLGVKMPTCREVYRVLYEGKPLRQGMVDLLTRRLKEEIQDDAAGAAP